MSSRLDRLVRLLQRREDAAAVMKAATGRAVTAAEAELAEARFGAQQIAPPAAQLTPVQLQALRVMGLGAVEHMERAEAALRERQGEDTEAERERSVAAVRRRSVERLAERRRTTFVRAAAAASQRSLDELAALQKARP
jgi:flagellar protein FliJ